VALRDAIVAVQDKNLAIGDPQGFRHGNQTVVDYCILQYLLSGMNTVLRVC
jgi:hypothetical protein